MGSFCSVSWRAEYLHKLFDIPDHGRFVFTPTRIYLFSHLFIAVWTQVYLLYTSGYNPIVPYLLCCTDCSMRAIGALSIGSCVPLTYSIIVCVFKSTSKLSGTRRCSRFILCVSWSSPRISYFSMESWFPSLENGFETNIWGYVWSLLLGWC